MQSVVLNEDYWNEDCERQLRQLVGEKTGLTKVRTRMSVSLVLLTLGVIYGLLGTAIEFNSGVPVMIDTHLGALGLLAAGALVLIARAFLGMMPTVARAFHIANNSCGNGKAAAELALRKSRYQRHDRAKER